MARQKKYRDVHDAVEAGEVEALRQALAAADDPSKAANAEDPAGEPPLAKAIKCGHSEMLAVLAKSGAALHNKKEPMLSALVRVAEKGDLAMLAELLRIEPAKTWTKAERAEALEQAANQNRPDVMDALPEVNGAPLGEIAARAAFLGHAATLGWCLSHGLDAQDTRMMGGETATLLHHAAGSGRAATTAVLIDAGTDLNARDNLGRTPLMHAARSEPELTITRVSDAVRLALAREQGWVIGAVGEADSPPPGRPDTALGLLLAADADATLKDNDGLDAMGILEVEHRTAIGAAHHQDATSLATLAADVAAMFPVDDVRAMWGSDDAEACKRVLAIERAARKRMVMTYAVALRQAGATGTPEADRAVADAVRFDRVDALKQALAAGGSVTVTIVTKNGYGATTPLGWAALQGYVESCRVLLDAGADPNDGGRDGPPLLGAIRADRREVVRLLLDRGADQFKPDPADREYSPIDAARIAGRIEIVAMLKAVGVGEAEATEPFKPDASFNVTATELLVKADIHATARAIASAIGGQAEHDVLHKTITAATNRGYLIVQLDGSEWTSVLPRVGCERNLDESWHDLARDASKRLGVLAALLCYEKVSSMHAYWLYDSGRQVERFEEDMGEPEFGDSGVWESERDRRRPRNMRHGHRVLQKLSRDEGFCIFLSNPGGTAGEPFEVIFPCDRRKLAGVAYVRA